MKSLKMLSQVITIGLIVAAFTSDLFSEPTTVKASKVQKLELSLGKEIPLKGLYARRQVLATGHQTDGRIVDLTTGVKWKVAPEGLAEISSTGLITPKSSGTITVSAQIPSADSKVLTVSHELKIGDLDPQQTISFPRQIVPLFTKHGCNGGGCHGKSGGQNGFRLSLLGFYPEDDHTYLVKEGRGRRLFTASPDRSLLLLKGSNTVPHEGGERFKKGSRDYEIIKRWMLQGMPYGDKGVPMVTKVIVKPEKRILSRDGQQQLQVFAHYDNGIVEDVTQFSLFEPNDKELATVTPNGLVSATGRTGSVGIMVRYAGNVGVFRATVPLGVKVEKLPPKKNFVDEIVFKKLVELGLPPSEICDDATFIRRLTIDLTGRIPTEKEVQDFTADLSTNKRDALIERLLVSRDHAEYFANKWSNILRNKRSNGNYTRGTIAFHSWIQDQFHQNLPYDKFVSAILAASGDVETHPPVAWYRSVRSVEEQVEDSAQLFLGTRIQCARCHHHPFEIWSQEDYYGYAAFFTRVGKKNGKNGLNANDEPIVFHQRGTAQMRNPRTGNNLRPTELGGKTLEIAAYKDPRKELVKWMVKKDNPFFAPAFVNRYWKHFMRRGLVEPEDDLRITNPPSNPELLDALSNHFIESGFDMRDLIRKICQSSVYQLSATPNEHNAEDRQNYSRFFPRRLPAEVLFDALNQVTTGHTGGFPGLPEETRAVALPDGSVNNYFLTVFGRPMAESACECERSQESSLAQCLHLLNSKDLQGKIESNSGRAAKLSKDKRSFEEKLTELYRWAFARKPTADEIAVAKAYIDKAKDKKQGFEDLVWALINTKEFLFNH